MLGMFKVAHLIGKTRNEETRFREAELALTKRGYICFAPVIYNLDEYLANKPLIDQMCQAKLYNADIVVLVTPEHIGEQTDAMLHQAREMGLPTFVFTDKREDYLASLIMKD